MNTFEIVYNSLNKGNYTTLIKTDLLVEISGVLGLNTCSAIKLANKKVEKIEFGTPYRKLKDKKINTRTYNLNTSTVQRHLEGKSEITKKLFEELDKRFMNYNKIIRNSLVKVISYRSTRPVVELQLKYSEILVNFHMFASKFDDESLLKDRIGYKNQLVNKQIVIRNLEDIDYVEYIFNNLVNELYNFNEYSLADELHKYLKEKVLEIDDKIIEKKLYRTIVFRYKNNLCSISKRKYGLQLVIDDKKYKIISKSDIEDVIENLLTKYSKVKKIIEFSSVKVI